MSQQQDGRPGGGMDLTTLAEELGVTTDELQTAMDTVRATAQGPDGMAAALAKELGLSEEEIVDVVKSERA
jgi:hypothetical protein